MRSDETLREYTNRYFENRNTLAGVKDDDVIAYYKKGITDIKLFEKIHEADAKTIGDLMAYIDKLVHTQDAVMHDFNGEHHDDRDTRSRKRSGEDYVTDPPKASTFLEGDFNMVMDDQCQFHRDAKHTMRECEQLKCALGVPSTSEKTRSNGNDDRNGGQRFDNRNRRPYPHNADRNQHDCRRDYRTMTVVTTTVAMTATTGATTIESIVVMIAMMIITMTDETTDVMIDVARMTIDPAKTTGRSGLHHHRPKGATPMVHSRRPTARSTSSLEVAKRSKATDRLDQTPGTFAMV
jgi:hypothetical protein